MLRFCSWSKLKRFAQGPAIRSTALVPFLGTALLVGSQYYNKFHGVDFLENATQGNYKFLHFLFEANIISTILNMYYGFTLTGFGYLIYIWSCPSTISSHVDVNSYILDTSPFDTPNSLKKISETMPNDNTSHISNLDKTVSAADFLHSISLKSSVQLPRDEWARSHATNIIEVKRAFYEWSDEQHPILRVITMFLFGFGLALASIPALRTMYKITTTFII